MHYKEILTVTGFSVALEFLEVWALAAHCVVETEQAEI